MSTAQSTLCRNLKVTPGVAISIVNSKREYLEPTAAVSGKTSKKEDVPKSGNE